MAFPILPVALAAGAVIWAWWLGKNSNSKQNMLELEDKIVEATVELLPYKESGARATDAPDILSKIAKAINDAGATGSKDLEKVMTHLNPADQQRAVIVLIAMEFLQWLEQNRADEYSALALPHRSDATSRSSAVATIEPEDVYASARDWLAKKKQNGEFALPIELAKECGCLNSKGGSKKLFKSRERADKAAEFWRKKAPDQPPQESYPCPKGKGFHLRTKKKPH